MAVKSNCLLCCFSLQRIFIDVLLILSFCVILRFGVEGLGALVFGVLMVVRYL